MTRLLERLATMKNGRKKEGAQIFALVVHDCYRAISLIYIIHCIAPIKLNPITLVYWWSHASTPKEKPSYVRDTRDGEGRSAALR